MDINDYAIELTFNDGNISEIKRCLENLYGTKAGTQPMDRNFGINDQFVGMPIEVAENMLTLEIIEKTEMYEPRVKVNSITFEVDSENGRITPTIKLEKGDGFNE